MLGLLNMLLGQINIEGFEQAAEQNVLFAVLVSIVIVLFIGIILLYKRLDDTNKTMNSALEKWKNDAVLKEKEKSEQFQRLTKDYNDKYERIIRENQELVERIRRENQDFQKDIVTQFKEITKEQLENFKELRKESLAKEDARNKKWEESEKEILNVLKGVTSVLDLSEAVKERDTKDILERLSSIDSKLGSN
jgi:DNA anti-recombination protein RmuC